MSEATPQETGAQVEVEATPEVENTGSEHLEKVEASEQEEAPERVPAQKVVPLAALHEERQRVKEMREQIRMGNERLNQLTQLVHQRLTPTQEAAQQPEIPDVNVDAVGHFKARAEALERQVRQLSQPVQEMRQQSEQERQVNALRQHVQTQEAQFAQSTPDYPQALKHMQSLSVQGMKALGYPEAQAQAMVGQEYVKLAHRVASQNENVAEHIYQLALANGYQKQAAATGQEKMQNLQKGTAAARSLGSGGGVASKLSMQALAEMPADEFAKAVSDADFRKLMGG